MIRFVPISAVIAIQSELVREFGGQAGLRDRGLLESAITRPKHIYHYEDADLYQLAASYAYGIIKNHPFIDGNKRTGFTVAYAFLRINGFDVTASEEETVLVMTGVADGSVGEESLSYWYKTNTQRF